MIFTAATGRWVAGGAAALVLLFGVYCWDRGNVRQAVQSARAEAADSVGRAWAARAQLAEDSARRAAAIHHREDSLAESQATQARDAARRADIRAAAAQALLERARDSVAQASPYVRRVIDSLAAALSAVTAAGDTLARANHALVLRLDTAGLERARLLGVVSQKDTVIAQDRRTIAAFRASRAPGGGLLRTAVRVLEFAGAATGGYLIGHAAKIDSPHPTRLMAH